MDDALLAQEFPHDECLIHLNHAGIGPWPTRTIEAIRAFSEENLHFGALHYPRWSQIEFALRQQFQTLLNAPSTDDIALLKNTSEALSMVAMGLDWQAGQNVVLAHQEFPSNRIVWQALESRGVEVRMVDLYSVDTPEDALLAACDEKTRLLTTSAVHYADGLRMDLERLGQFCEYNDILFCVDAIQQLGVLPIDVQQLGIHFLMADGHKWMLGPEGVAVFYCAEAVRERLQLSQFGWHMMENMGDFTAKEWQPAASARRFECGSPNSLGSHALHASLSLLLQAGIDSISRNILKNTSYLIDIITESEHFSLATPEGRGRHAGIVSFKLQHGDTESLYRHLMNKGIYCAYRSGNIRFSPHFLYPAGAY